MSNYLHNELIIIMSTRQGLTDLITISNIINIIITIILIRKFNDDNCITFIWSSICSEKTVIRNTITTHNEKQNKISTGWYITCHD